MTSAALAAAGAHDMCESREQPVVPELTQSWFAAVRSCEELDADSTILSQDSIDAVVVDAVLTQNTGRAESPLRVDVNELNRIDTSASGVHVRRRKNVRHFLSNVDLLWFADYVCAVPSFFSSLPLKNIFSE